METTNISSEGVNASETSIPDISWIVQYYEYVTYILTAVGLVGNILSLIVLMLSPKRFTIKLDCVSGD